MTFMTLALVLSALAGALVGLRLTVLALVPGLAISVVLIAFAGAVCDQSFWFTLLAQVGGMIGLQSGYLGGSAVRFGSQWRLRHVCWPASVRPSLPAE